MFSAWYGGVGPGLLAIALSALGFKYYFLPPIYSLAVEITQLPRLVLFAVSALFVGSLSAAQRSAAESLRRARDELQQAFQQLQSTHEELQTENIERNRAQEVLHEQASLLNLTHDTIFVRDMNDVISYWNRGAEELYGWKKEKAIGQVSHQLMQTIFPLPLEQINRELLRTGRWEGELVHSKADGTPIAVASRWSLQRNDRQQPLAILETNNDLTERKRVESELWRVQLEMGRVERLAALGKMTGAIAHELGTPLNSLLGYTQLLAVDDLSETARRRLGIIETQIHPEIIQHYLSQSRGSAPRMRIHVNDLIRETLLLLQPIFQQHGMVVTTDLAEAPPALFGDAVSLQRVLINLINNGVDASAGNGRINIKTLVSSGAVGEAPGVIIEITDNGAGIPPEILPKIFDLFVTTKPVGKGTGLGLAISQEIIKAHGGTIKVSTQVGQGTTVQVILPPDVKTGESVMEKRV